MSRKKQAPLAEEGDADGDGDGKIPFHGRGFPNGAFLPGSFRALSPRRTDAAVLNALLGVEPAERNPGDLVKAVLDGGFLGDLSARKRFESFVDDVWFPKNRGIMGKVGQEVLISHIGMGMVFRPKQHYNSDKWARAILRTGGGDDDLKELLAEAASKAQARTMNLVEKALVDSLDANPPKAATEQEALLALPELNATLVDLVRNLLRQVRWEGSTNDDAERVMLDVVALLRTGIYLNWLLMHDQAFAIVSAFRAGTPAPTGTPRLLFGMSKERRIGVGRFHDTQAHLEDVLEEGSFAIIALSQLHQVMGWKDSKWFTDLIGPEGDKPAPAKAKTWFDGYAAAMSARGVEAPFVPETLPTNIRGLLVEMYVAIQQNFKRWRPSPNTRFSNRSTLGSLGSMAQAEGGALFAPMKGSKKLLPMIDIELYLLVGRAVMTSTSRAAARLKINSQLERLGIRVDDTTQAELEKELERTGRLRKLSDAGESLYVRVD